LPEVIRTDNGVPFATTALGRLSALSVWWIRLGIFPELIEPAHPQQNGSHERMHRTLKRETIRPPKRTLAAQQVCFNRFRREYNEERPHEALGLTTPASRTIPRRGCFQGSLPTSPIPLTTRCATSALTAAFAGSASGSASPIRSPASSSD
jgi:putative transposase